MTKKIVIAFCVLSLAFVVTGCGKKAQSDVQKNNTEQQENVKVKPAEVELQSRPGDQKELVTKKSPKDVDLNEVSAFVTEVQTAEAVADSEINRFNSLNDNLDKELSL
ncbi:MAG: hypothetical protein WC310_03370 [Patescibacteria group bacterium]|jgi:hypothetical protein